MSDIIDLSELNAKRVRKKFNRMAELERMIHCCEVTRQGLRDIQDLIDKEILLREPGGGRSTSYVVNITT